MSDHDAKQEAADKLFQNVAAFLEQRKMLYTPTQGSTQMKWELDGYDELEIKWHLRGEIGAVAILTARVSIRSREVRFYITSTGMKIDPQNLRGYGEAYRCAEVVNGLFDTAIKRYKQS